MWLGSTAGGAAVWFSPFFLGPLLAVPLAMVSASPTLSAHLTRLGLWRVPEETTPDPLLSSLDLQALGSLAGKNRSVPDTPGGRPATAVEAAE
jgi:membrane glycosyltransferase